MKVCTGRPWSLRHNDDNDGVHARVYRSFMSTQSERQCKYQCEWRCGWTPSEGDTCRTHGCRECCCVGICRNPMDRIVRSHPQGEPWTL